MTMRLKVIIITAAMAALILCLTIIANAQSIVTAREGGEAIQVQFGQSQPGFNEGWRIGWSEGWKHVKGQYSQPPFPPFPPFPKHGQDHFKGGYNAGFLAGVARAMQG